MIFENHFHERQSRRAALKKLGMAVGAELGIGTGLFSSLGTTFASSNPIKHVVILCQENRTFDHYFGYYARAGQYGVPAGFSVPGGILGGRTSPYHLPSRITIWEGLGGRWEYHAIDWERIRWLR